MTPAAVLLLFIDGVGLGEDDASINPLAAARLPVMRALLDGRAPLLSAAPYHGTRASLLGLDATLGTPGTPQSGTGQTALLTGEDAVALHGRHFGPWVPARLRSMLREQSILARAQRVGRRVAFANAYPRELAEIAAWAAEHPHDTPAHVPASKYRRLPLPLRTGPPLAAMGARVMTRHAEALATGAAIASEIVNDGWRESLGYKSLPVITAAEAGANLARVTAAHDLTLFAHYATDLAGHTQSLEQGVAAIERVDAFLGGLLEVLPSHAVVFVASDHGNLEDIRVGHTRNPALGLCIGAPVSDVTKLTDVAAFVLSACGVAA